MPEPRSWKRMFVLIIFVVVLLPLRGVPPITYSISGNVGVAVAGAKLDIACSDMSSGEMAESNESGSYTFPSESPGACIIGKPFLAGYTFTPDRRYVTITNSNVTDVNFTATKTKGSKRLEELGK